MAKLLKAVDSPEQGIFWGIALLTILSIGGAIFFDEPLILGLPLAAVLVLQTLINYKAIYILLLASIPLSTEFYFSDSLATDLPIEPLLAGLMLVYLLQIVLKPQTINGRFWQHPVTLILLAHFGWILVSTVFSANFGISVKYSLAKLWYIIGFFFLTGHILRNEKEVWKAWWWIIIPLGLATAKVFIHHYFLGFGFKEINAATSPFFRNHVNYAAILALMIPFLWFFWGEYKRWSLQWIVLGAIMLILFSGMLFAYTRAAYVAVFLAFGAYFVIRLRLMRWAIAFGMIGLIAVFTYLGYNNKFMDYAPSERTIAHTEFGDIVSATYKLEDISTMERYYRWIAGFRMSNENLATGFGPGNFHSYYKSYTLNRFTTYVSDNPERSGIHNYFLMTLVEQGIPGVLFFVSLIFATFWYGEKVYHETANKSRKALAMGLMLILVVIDAFLLMNDLIETDKVGSFFFISTAILVNLDLLNKEQSKDSTCAVST